MDSCKFKKGILLIIVLILLGCGGKRTENGLASQIDSVSEKEIEKVALNVFTYRGPDTLLNKLDSLLTVRDTVSALSLIQVNDFNLNKEFPYYGTILFHFVTGLSNLQTPMYPEIKHDAVIIKFLLSKGSDPNAVGACWGEYTCRNHYIVSCDRAISELLIKAGSKYQLNHTVVCASKEKNKTAIKDAIEKGADPTYALPFAYNNDRPFFDELLDSKANKDAALQLACGSLHEIFYNNPTDQTFQIWKYEPDTSLFKRIVKKGANPNIGLPLAIQYHYKNLTQFLLNSGADRSEALYNACVVEDSALIAAMVQQGGQLNKGSGIAWSKNEKLKSMVLPVTNGKAYSEIFHGPDSHSSELLRSCEDGDLSALKFMLEAGANPNVYGVPVYSNDFHGCKEVSALAIAMANNNREMIKLLKKYKAKLPGGCSPPKTTGKDQIDN